MLIVLEGIDGCGKSTQVSLLVDKLRSIGIDTLKLREPTDSPHGLRLRSILNEEIQAEHDEILDLFVKDRKQHVSEKIAPALNSEKTIVMDRYYYSTMAYQSASGFSMEQIRADNSFAPVPTLVLILDISAKDGVKRVLKEGNADRFEKEDFLNRVREQYLKLKNEPNVEIIDASLEVQEVHANIWSFVENLMES
uniref:Probable thymidylate kinase n=1 Tax=uncultured marine group II/III euryarchaeote AD1000_91_C10 TaxID=1457825 RepID=A0A075G0J0_9EURY|nr:thymidylate kinase (tmk) [uncultured marine group II/III euryarchaeote AD1000_91_C10]